jgi:DNA repair exonuclease SbcCD ATPase subunit
LSENFDVDIITNQDIGEIARIQNEIDRLQLEYDNDEEVRGDLLDEISELEDEITEFENKIDVYNIIPTGSFYATSQFEVIGVPNLEDRTYAVGDEDEMQRSAYEYVDQLIDDIGYRGFNPTFAKEFIDEKAIISYAEDLFNDDVYNNTENYVDNSQRNLSDGQEEKIGILNSKIEKYKSLISSFEDEIDNDEMESENNDEIIEKIDELNDEITEMETEIQDEIENPEGSFPDDLIEDIIEKQLKEVRYDVTSFMDEWGLDWEEYVDKDEFINGVVDADGYGHTLNGYDGTAEEITVLGDLYYVMRID